MKSNSPVSKRGRCDGLKSHRVPFDSGTGDQTKRKFTVDSRQLTVKMQFVLTVNGKLWTLVGGQSHCEIVQLVGLQILNLAMLVRIKLSQPDELAELSITDC